MAVSRKPTGILMADLFTGFIKKHFGPSAVIYATYLMGVVIVLVALGLLINVLIVTQS